MKTLLKVLGYIFVFIALVGAPQVMINNNFHWITLVVLGFYLGLAWLCFKGSKYLKKKQDEQKKIEQTES